MCIRKLSPFHIQEYTSGEIYFTHLNHTNLALDPEGVEHRQMEEKGFRLASDGMEFFL